MKDLLNRRLEEIPMIHEKIYRANRRLFLDNGRDLYSQMIEEYKDNVIFFLKWIRNAVIIGDSSAMEQYLRTFRGACQLVAAARLTVQVSHLINRAAEGLTLTPEDVQLLTDEVQLFLKEVDHRINSRQI
jgi:hypothetical protein